MNSFEDDIESVIKRYVFKQLSEIEASAFEDYFVSRPDIVSKIEVAQKIQIGLSVKRGSYDTAKKKESVLQKLNRWLFFPIPGGAIAVSLLLSLIGIQQMTKSNYGDLSLNIVDIGVPVERSGVEIRGVNFRPSDKRAAFILRVPSVKYPKYVVQILDVKNKDKLVWQSTEFTFSSGKRDQLIEIPEEAAIISAKVVLLGIDADQIETATLYCNYTEICK